MGKVPGQTYCIYLELPSYLRDWVINDCGGETPVRFPKLSVENINLRTYLIPLPHSAKPDQPTPTSLAIAIPEFKIKDPETYNYLPKARKQELKKCIRDRFIEDLWMSLRKNGWIGKRRDRLIEDFMEAHGIENTDRHTNSILKIYQRTYVSYKKNKGTQLKTGKKSKKSSRL